MTPNQLARTARRMVLDADAEELGKLTVSEIAKRLMVNRSTLSRAFSNYCYITLRLFLELRKIVKFEMLVINNKAKTVKEALEILDIRDPSHFIKRYRAVRRRSPGEYCRKWRGKNNS